MPPGGLTAEEYQSLLDKDLNGHIESGCSWCLRVAKGGISVQKCARCKGPQYCSRECQVKHWPEHKVICQPVTEQQENVLRAILHLQKNPKEMQTLRTAIALYFLKQLKAHPDKKKWSAIISVYVHPYGDEDFKSLENIALDMKPLLKKSMPGHTTFLGVHDDKDFGVKLTAPPFYFRQWEYHRQLLAGVDLEESCSFFVHFRYPEVLLHSSLIAIHPEDIARAQRWANLRPGVAPIGRRNIPLQRVNAFLKQEGESNKKMSFDLTVGDKEFIREMSMP